MQHDEVHLTRAYVHEAILDTQVLMMGQECRHHTVGGCVDCVAEVATDAVMVVIQELTEEAVRRVHVARFAWDEGGAIGPDNFYNGVLASRRKLRDLQQELNQETPHEQDPGQEDGTHRDP